MSLQEVKEHEEKKKEIEILVSFQNFRNNEGYSRSST